ncbi:putative ADP-ribosylation factor [Blattamonas nauphoetae]|uniref:ADP-ribosylation factor n=1 Tax=Blattamonas nauphoetae TaxID=2049346 RepID=A0ABQ9XXN7_9EUKA|nr:putative ADP-ribosylation factor [Blattamonas nauphoetae]
MGLLSFLRKLKLKEKEIRILLIGLDGAGKTTTLKQLKGESTEGIASTKGFNIETFQLGEVKLNVWDIGGQSYIRPYWRNYFEETEGIVWVVDSTDHFRIQEGISELEKVLKTEKLAGASLLVFANKQDIRGAMTPEEIANSMKLTEIVQNRHWKIQASSAITGEGVLPGFRWIVQDVCSRLFTFN